MAERVKDRYSVPFSLDSSFLDISIPLGTDSWNSFTLSVRTIVYGAASFMLYIILLHNSDTLSQADMWVKACVAAAWLWVTWLLMSKDRAGELRSSHVIPVIKYMSKSNRNVSCRQGDEAYALKEIIPFRHTTVPDVYLVETISTGITDSRTRLWMRCFRVLGNASALLFDEDRNEVLAHVASFWESFPPGVEVVQISRKEGQSTDAQVVSLKKRFDSYTGDDPDVVELFNDEMRVLSVVSEYSRITHQYLCVMASSLDVLEDATRYLEREIRSSTWVFKSLVPVSEEEIDDLFAPIFNGARAGLSDL